MPTRFAVDSLTVLKDLFAGIKINHIDDNIIEIRTPDSDLIPFTGILESKDRTIFFRATENKPAIPFLKLDAPKFDTLEVVYSDYRSDKVTAMGKMHDAYLGDSVQYFDLKPIRRTSSYESIYLKSIGVKSGEGIRYLTFGKEHYDFTIAVL